MPSSRSLSLIRGRIRFADCHSPTVRSVRRDVLRRRRRPPIPGFGSDHRLRAPGAHRQAVELRTGADGRPSGLLQKQRDGPCRLDRPSPKLRRETALQRAISALVPLTKYQALCANAGQTCASTRPLPEQRLVGGSPTGAGNGVRTFSPERGRSKPRSRCFSASTPGPSQSEQPNDAMSAPEDAGNAPPRPAWALSRRSWLLASSVRFRTNAGRISRGHEGRLWVELSGQRRRDRRPTDRAAQVERGSALGTRPW